MAGEPVAIHDGPNILIQVGKSDGLSYFTFDVKRELDFPNYLPKAVEERLEAMGFGDVSPEGDGSAWMGPLDHKSSIVQLARKLDGMERSR